MKKKTAIIVFLCFVCVAVIGICVMAGISKWQNHQTAQQREQQLRAYMAELNSTFDDLYQVETNLLNDIAQQQTAGISSQDILLDAIDAVGKPMDALASVKAPEDFAEVQRHFVTAAQSYHTMSDELTALLQDDNQNPEQLRETLIDLLPDAIDAIDQIRYGIQALENQDDISLPDSAVQLKQSLDTLMNSEANSLIPSH